MSGDPAPARPPPFPTPTPHRPTMAAERLVDFASLDLDQVLMDKEAILAQLEQRGRFEMIDAVTYLDPDEALIVGYKDVDESSWWVPDHIPGRPLFPGALMIEAAAQIATLDFKHRHPDMADKFIGFAGIDRVRFRGAVEPPNRFWIVGRVARVRRTMFTYDTQGFVDDRLVFEGQVMGMVV